MLLQHGGRVDSVWAGQHIGSSDKYVFAENSTMDIYDMLLHRAAVICDNQHVAVVAKKRTQDS